MANLPTTIVRSITKGTRGGSNGGKKGKTKNTNQNGYNRASSHKSGSVGRDNVVDADYRIVRETSKANNQKTRSNAPRVNNTASSRRNPVSTALNRRHEYRMTHGKEIERSKQAASIGGSITTSALSDDYSDRQVAQEYSDAAKAAAEANASRPTEYTYNINENKNWKIDGITQAENGGATKAVNPATGQYENTY